jgi:hypothetical protein
MWALKIKFEGAWRGLEMCRGSPSQVPADLARAPTGVRVLTFWSRELARWERLSERNGHTSSFLVVRVCGYVVRHKFVQEGKAIGTKQAPEPRLDVYHSAAPGKRRWWWRRPSRRNLSLPRTVDEGH